MNAKMRRLQNSIVRFHQDEEGLEALQVVMIIAVAAIMLLFIKMNWGKIKDWFSGLMSQVLGWKE